jgi:hypothetical protein
MNLAKEKAKLFGRQVLYDSKYVYIYYQHNAIHYDDKVNDESYYIKLDFHNNRNKKYQVLSVKWDILQKLNEYESKYSKVKWDKYINKMKSHFKKNVFEEIVKKVFHPSRFGYWKSYGFVELDE